MHRLAWGFLTLPCLGCGPLLGIEDTELVADKSACELVVVRTFFAEKPDADGALTIGAPTRADVRSLGDALGVDVNVDQAHVLAGIRDCQGMPVEDAELALEAPTDGTTFFALDDSGPEIAMDTSENGFIGLLDAPIATELKLSALPISLAPSASSIGDVQTRAGELAVIELSPNSEATAPTMPAGPFLCVGMVPEPEPVDVVAQWVITVRHAPRLIANGPPIANARVRVCFENGEPCDIDLTAPLGPTEALTDKDGRAVVQLPLQGPMDDEPEGFDGSVVVAGELAECES